MKRLTTDLNKSQTLALENAAKYPFTLVQRLQELERLILS